MMCSSRQVQKYAHHSSLGHLMQQWLAIHRCIRNPLEDTEVSGIKHIDGGGGQNGVRLEQ